MEHPLGRQITVENMMNEPRVYLAGDGAHRIRLAALERRVLPDDTYQRYAPQFDATDEVRVRFGPIVAARPKLGDLLIVLAFGAVGITLMAGITLAMAEGDFRWIIGLVAALGATYGLFRLIVASRGDALRDRFGTGSSLAAVIAVAFILPGMVLGWATDWTLPYDLSSQPDAELAYVFARLVQFALIGLAAFLPAYLFFVFDRQRGETIRERLVRSIFRLDPDLVSLHDVEARYGEQLAELGSDAPGGPQRRARRSTVVVATLLLAGGWLITVGNSAVSFADGESFNDYVLRLLTPHRSLIAYAFLGTYFFSLLLVMRSYLRGDLQPKTYGLLSARVLEVFILTFVLAQLVQTDAESAAGAAGAEVAGDPWLLVAFAIGIVPSEVLRWVQNYVNAFGKKVGRSIKANLYELEPLTQIHGIDLYDQTRLQMEGINNVEALAHSEVIGLMLQTRIPTERIVDWVDQAALLVRIEPDRSNSPDADGVPAPADLRAWLRWHSVRTATDLLQVYPRLIGVLGEDVAARRLELAVATLQDEEWIPQLLAWREGSQAVVLTD